MFSRLLSEPQQKAEQLPIVSKYITYNVENLASEI